jgi:uncharacterized membrane protein
MSRALGVLGLGLGAAQAAQPEALGRWAGVGDSPAARDAVRLAGVRQLLTCVPLLSSDDPAPWVWARVAGDLLDLALLGRAARNRGGDGGARTVLAAAAVAGVAAVDLYTAAGAFRRTEPAGERGAYLHAAVTVNRPREAVYRAWRDLADLPRCMAHLESVEELDAGRTRWRAHGPLRRSVEWDAAIVEERHGELVSWRSVGRGRVHHAGSVRFFDAPGGRGTEVHVELTYRPPAGKAGAAAARLLGEHPKQQVRDDLRRFKQVLEAGEVVRSEGSPEGTLAFRQARQRPARPPSAA